MRAGLHRGPRLREGRRSRWVLGDALAQIDAAGRVDDTGIRGARNAGFHGELADGRSRMLHIEVFYKGG